LQLVAERKGLYPERGSGTGLALQIDDLMRSERINDAFELMHQGKSIRSVIEY
jgi:hypothetical protein